MKIIIITVALLLVGAIQVKASGDHNKSRVKKAIHRVTKNVTHDFKYTYRARVKNNSEANAWAFGPYILVTTGLLEKLDDKELTAVVAHEIAHVESFHHASRMIKLAGGVFLGFFGAPGVSYSDNMQGFLKYIVEEQEVQADCIAYYWLKELNANGFSNMPDDLNRATESIVNVKYMVKHFPSELISQRYLENIEGHRAGCH